MNVDPWTNIEPTDFISRPRPSGPARGAGAGFAAPAHDGSSFGKTAARLRSRTLARNGMLPATEAERPEPNYELVIAQSNLVPAWFLARGAECARAIARVEARGVAHNGARGSWNGTGFLVSPNILLTNWHVLNSIDVARHATARFRYEHAVSGALDEGVPFQVNPERLFVSNRELDFTFVWIDGEPGRQFGQVALARNAFSVVEDEFVNIVQHPNGRPKELAIQENLVCQVDVEVVLYTTDTEPGSSGSCVFNNRWMPVALHHASKNLDGGRVLNEGIRLAAIAAHLERTLMDEDPAVSAASRELLSLFNGIDEVMGFFGALGRSPDVAAVEGLEVVRQSYDGEAYDVDIGIWRLPLGAREDNLARIAEAMVRMNLDVWAFFDVPVDTLRQLTDLLSLLYGLSLKTATAEPVVAGVARAAVLWNTLTLSGQPRRWPSQVEQWFEPGPARTGNLPGIFEFRATSRVDGLAPFEFFLVPLQLVEETAARLEKPRGLEVVTAAIYAATRESGNARDWFIAGGFDAARAASALGGLAPAGLTASVASTGGGGAIAHLRGSRSSVDGLYVPAGFSWLGPEGRAQPLGIASQPLPAAVRELSPEPLLALRASLDDAEADAAFQSNPDVTSLDRVLEELSALPHAKRSDL